MSHRVAAPPLWTDERGAALAELVLVLLPVLLMLFCFAQLTFCAMAQLMVRHAAVVAARTAAVVSSDRDNQPGEPGPSTDIRDAALVAMAPWSAGDAIGDVEVLTRDASDRSDPYGPVTVTVRVVYRCSVPLGAAICRDGRRLGRVRYEASASMPHQGALYRR